MTTARYSPMRRAAELLAIAPWSGGCTAHWVWVVLTTCVSLLIAASAAYAADLAPPEFNLSSAAVLQEGNGHYAVFGQVDDLQRNQRIALTQSGDPQRATLTQTGSDNLITATQQGAGNLLDVAQSGRFNQIDIRQSGSNSATLRQIGHGNSATITQAAGSAPLLLEQIGDGKVYSLIQY